MKKLKDNNLKAKSKTAKKRVSKTNETDEVVRASEATKAKIIVYTLVFCAVMIAYITIKGASPEMGESRLYETLAIGGFGLAGSVIGFYVGGTAWQNIRLSSSRSQK